MGVDRKEGTRRIARRKGQGGGGGGGEIERKKIVQREAQKERRSRGFKERGERIRGGSLSKNAKKKRVP